MMDNSDMKFIFTKEKLEEIKPQSKGIYYTDEQCPYLKLLVSKTGLKMYYLYKKINKKPVKLSLCEFDSLSIDDARLLAQKQLRLLQRKADYENNQVDLNNDITFEEFFNLYMERHSKPFKKSWLADVKDANNHILPYIGHLPLTEVRRRDIIEICDRLASKGKFTASNHQLVRLRTVYNKAIDWEYTKVNPSLGIKKHRLHSRERFLSKTEFKLLLGEVSKPEHNLESCHVIRILIFTGVRRSNVFSMRWNDINFDECTWRIPKTKNGRPHIVFLAPSLIELLNERKHISQVDKNKLNYFSSPYVFPSKSVTGHITDIKKTWDKIRNNMDVPDIRIHDLRRTFGTYMAMQGENLVTIADALGHADLKSTQIYARINKETSIKATKKITNYMCSLGQKGS